MTTTQIMTINHQDEQVIHMWLHGRSEHTQRYYSTDVRELLHFAEKSIQQITLSDLQAYADSLTHLKEGSQARKLNSVKSLLTFAHEIGYVPMNVGKALRAPKIKSTLAQRIMSEEAVIKMISLEENQRNHAILRLLYHCGLRVSEIVSLQWDDLQLRQDGGQATIFGKGGKTRHVLISQSMWDELMLLPGREASGSIFKSRKKVGNGEGLDTSQVNRIVSSAAKRAGVKGNVSPHWLRHAHASHSLDRGAPINLVRETLGHASIATTGKYTHARPSESSSRYLPL